jgi:hypothetical protein
MWKSERRAHRRPYINRHSLRARQRRLRSFALGSYCIFVRTMFACRGLLSVTRAAGGRERASDEAPICKPILEFKADFIH